MDSFNVRYGEDVTIPIQTGRTDDVSADIYIGMPGEQYILTKSINLLDGEGVFHFSQLDTQIPLGVYSFQVNITDASGYLIKFPEAEGCSSCDDDFPKFIVSEALDLTEVIS